MSIRATRTPLAASFLPFYSSFRDIMTPHIQVIVIYCQKHILLTGILWNQCIQEMQLKEKNSNAEKPCKIREK